MATVTDKRDSSSDLLKTERDAAKDELFTVKAEQNTARDELITLKAERKAARGYLATARLERNAVRAEVDKLKKKLANVKFEKDAARVDLLRVKKKLVTVIGEQDVGTAELATVKTYFLTSNDFLVRVQQPLLFQFFKLCESVCLHNERILLNAVYSFNSLLLHLVHILCVFDGRKTYRYSSIVSTRNVLSVPVT